MKNTLKFALTALLLAAAPIASADAIDCVKLSKAVKVAVVADSSRVLEVVASYIASNESCACEIVKAAIIASDANEKQVASIVNAAILEAPSQIRLIAQCAIATAPDAVANVQAVLEQYDVAGGEGHSGKGGLDQSKDAAKNPPAGSPAFEGANPLDYPFDSISNPIEKDSRFQPEFAISPLEEDPGATDLRDIVINIR